MSEIDKILLVISLLAYIYQCLENWNSFMWIKIISLPSILVSDVPSNAIVNAFLKWICGCICAKSYFTTFKSICKLFI